MKDDLELENQALTALTMNNLVPLSNTGGANNLANRHHSSAQGANNAAGQGTLFYANHICIKSWHSDDLFKKSEPILKILKPIGGWSTLYSNLAFD